MSVEHLPWDSLEGPIYYARDLKPRKPWVTYGCWILSAALIIGGIITPYRVAAVFGVLYILTLMMKKDTVITERGLEIFYQMRITTHCFSQRHMQNRLWYWPERKIPELWWRMLTRGRWLATRKRNSYLEYVLEICFIHTDFQIIGKGK